LGVPVRFNPILKHVFPSSDAALAFQRARYKHLAKKLNVTVVSAKDVITPAMGRWVKGNVDDKFKEFGMRLIQDVTCVSLDTEKDPTNEGRENRVVVLSDGQRLKFDLLTVATGAAAPDCLTKFHFLEKDDGGFLKVTQHLQSAAFPFIFGAGDCVSVESAPWIAKAGVYAVREGPFLAKNIMAFIRGMKMEAYEPQSGFLALMMTGDGEAISSWKGLSMSNSLMWSLKDKIDKAFMDRFNVQKLPKNPKLDYLKK
jgi:NADH dehydrogenase FAD-containing subunit